MPSPLRTTLHRTSFAVAARIGTDVNAHTTSITARAAPHRLSTRVSFGSDSIPYEPGQLFTGLPREPESRDLYLAGSWAPQVKPQLVPIAI